MSPAAKPARTILVTRPAHQAAGLMTALALRGFTPVAAPMLELKRLPAAIPDRDYDALVFTSANGVEAFAAMDTRRDIPLFAVGPATAAAARKAHFEWILAGDQGAEALAEIIAGRLKSGSRVLYPSARDVAVDLEAALAPAGIHVDRIVVYAMEPAPSLPETALVAMRAGCRAVFFSARSAGAFRALASSTGTDVAKVEPVFLFRGYDEALFAGWHPISVAPAPRSDDEIADWLVRLESFKPGL